MDIEKQMELFLMASEKEAEHNAEDSKQTFLLSQLPEAYDDFDYDDLIQEITVLMMIPASDLIHSELELIDVVRKYDPKLIEKVTNFPAPAFYEGEMTDEELDMLEYNDSFKQFPGEDIPFFDESSVFLKKDTPVEKCEIFIYSSNLDIVPINDTLYSYSHLPSLERILVNRYESKDISDFNHEVTDISNNYISISREGAQKLLNCTKGLLDLYENLDDVLFINEYVKCFGINGEDFPYFTVNDIQIIGEFLEEFSKVLDSFLKISMGERTFFQLVYTVEG